MAIDPDVQALLDGVYARLANLEAAPSGGAALGAVGLADIDSIVDFGDVLAATSDDEDSRLAARIAAVDLSALPSVPLPIGDESGEVGDLQTAYDALPDAGGVLTLTPNVRYDINDGLNLERGKRVVFTSPGRGGRARVHEGTTNAPVIFSSTGADTLVNFDLPGVGVYSNGYGFEFSNIDFEVSQTTTKVFQAVDMNYVRVVNCGAFYEWPTQGPGFTFIDSVNTLDTNIGADSSWWRVIDNYVAGGVLLSAVGFQVNRWVIRENIVFPDQMVAPCIYLENAHGCVIRDNNLEGSNATAGIHLRNCWGTRLDGNAGEKTTPFFLFDFAHANLSTDMGISYPEAGGSKRVFAKFINGSADNLIITPSGTSYNDMYDYAEWIDETENGTAQNWFIAPSSFPLPRRVEL